MAGYIATGYVSIFHFRDKNDNYYHKGRRRGIFMIGIIISETDNDGPPRRQLTNLATCDSQIHVLKHKRPVSIIYRLFLVTQAGMSKRAGGDIAMVTRGPCRRLLVGNDRGNQEQPARSKSK